jgi:hypothetical protein
MWYGGSAAMLAATQPPPEPFSGQRSEYPTFKAAWQRYVDILQMGGGYLPDSFVLARLEPILDAGSRSILKSELERNPRYTHAEFWQMMEKTFCGESPISARQNWEELQIATAGKLTPQNWRQFYADFRRLQHRISDATDGEAVRLLRQKLPERLAEKVESENCRRKKVSKWIEIRNIFGATEVDVINWVGGITGTNPRSVQKNPAMDGIWRVDCQHDTQKIS